MARWKERDWLDGHYELFMDFDDSYAWIDAAQTLWSQPQVSGVWTTREFDPDADPRLDANDAAVTCELMTRHLTGVARLPNGTAAPCGCGISQGRNWLTFFLPLAGLRRAYDIGKFPFGDCDRPWIAELDLWLANVGRGVFRQVPFKIAGIGSELYPLTDILDFSANVPKVRPYGMLVPEGNELLWYAPGSADSVGLP